MLGDQQKQTCRSRCVLVSTRMATTGPVQLRHGHSALEKRPRLGVMPMLVEGIVCIIARNGMATHTRRVQLSDVIVTSAIAAIGTKKFMCHLVDKT